MDQVQERLAALTQAESAYAAAAEAALSVIAQEATARFGASALEVTFDEYDSVLRDVALLGGGPRRTLLALDQTLWEAADRAATALCAVRPTSRLVVTP